ncbi:Polymorphic membrane protein F,chlamydial polymorphic outer membrane protein repeat,Autotransporter beta-domain [Chlamydia poikilotherma]|uniref:Polymorphic membrane protein F,chlamydial polymorphic outer membrane protein repeat,Autotransporter beta-domain n=1 Tax=Chlamydia poikilotherma TaxID=1967783 RepID=A0A3B0Q6L2_9CHLA|nr:polymorphic outer membrane protein middle domain-containing protein [Chlamydia poikilotherma]SYX08697.1 Polymorphic membrane protein F,chlamydial polymorphic outer membrane protein repeat,Autotransporter beta-domain [Chlamydia poikilotherma]
MKQMFFWKFVLLSSLTQLTQVSRLSGTEIILPLSGIHTGEDPELFTMLTTSPQGTNYTLRGEFTLKDFLGYSIHKSGGAFRNLEGNLTFTGSTPLATLNFTNLQLGGQGAGVFSKSLLTFENLKAVNVENNQSTGGVLTSRQDMFFTRNTNLFFQNNVSHGAGGAILLTGAQPNRMIFSEQRGLISFIKNHAEVVKNITNSGNGGAISSEVAGSSILFDGNQEILFQENYAKSGGGIYNAQGTVEFTKNKNTINFIENRALESGGAIYTNLCNINKQSAPVSFCKNSARKLGGAVYSQQIIIKNNDESVFFSENHAEGGGAIASTSCNLTASQSIIFSENSSGNLGGGAIYLSGPQPKLHLHAQNADIIFSGNITKISTKHSSITNNNAITIKGAPEAIRLIANENQSIIFYDPILATSQSINPVDINSIDNIFHCGSVIFSGEKLAIDRQDKSNKTSIFNQPVYLNNGTLSITSGAILAVQEFKQLGGILNLSPGSMLTSYNSLGKDLIISNISFGLDATNSHLPAEIRALGNSGIRLSGSPQIHDPDNIFYNNHDLASQPYQMEIIFKSDKNINTDGFIPEEIAVQQNAYGYQGVWKFNWSGENSKRHKTLKALWIPTGTFILNPEKEGYLVPSSTWTTFTGMRSSNDAILDNYLNNNMLIPIKHICIFGGIVSSVMEQNAANYNNFSMTQAGHNLGIKLPFSPNTVVCATFTQLHGSSSQDNIPGKSHSHMLLGTIAAFKNWRALSFRSSVSYAEESHVMKHQFSKKDITRGSWKNQGFRSSVGLSYAYPKGIRCLKITPFIDLEYTAISQNPFIETGYDPRYFASSHLSNLALPSGVSLEMRFFGAKYSLFTQFSMAYIKDLLRENPVTTASLILNQHSWKVAGVFIGQEAMNLKFRTTFKYRLATAYLGISTIQREGNNLSGDAFGGLSLTF